MMWIRTVGGKWHVLKRWVCQSPVLCVGVGHCSRRFTVIQATDDESKMKGERCKTCQKYDR